MAHWINATAEHKKRPVKINADNIAYLIREEREGPTHVHFVGSSSASGKPDLLVLEEPDQLLARMQRAR